MSVSLRASTKVSSGFAPLRHSSPSFGSRQACSHSNPSQKIKVGRRCNPLGDPTNQLPYALRYLFAIGLSPIFSLGRNLPLDWGCIPKQPDSPIAPRVAIGSEHDGAFTFSGAPFQGTWARSVAEDASPDYNSNNEIARFSSWAIPGFDNDPSAGSPTETLLRLLLPLNDKVQWTSRDVAGSEPPTSP
ncbi:hypothetical protein RHSIM_Rhsim02G0139400 [Rhododendron simsii]|uniref:Uncharacterized protein n=1 Tax=Rhododendron simsii TaxID=118357 RepID=A0A834H8H5_RHOSS|nr:hypothetical protein RHSIM_Rhsim02G0139400 [Rhododendron simsii]